MTNLPTWPSPPKNLVLSSGEVHVWRIALDAPAGQFTRLEQVFSVDERERAARFLFERGRLDVQPLPFARPGFGSRSLRPPGRGGYRAHPAGFFWRANRPALPDDLQKEAFFTCWTRKEAYIKARGEGLSLPLDQFDVTLTPGESARLLATRPDPDEATRWGLQALDPGPGYQAAVAAEGQGWRMKLLQFGLVG